jgi:hypothetical protein
LFAVSGLARLEGLSVPGATAVVGQLELLAGLVWISRGFACTGKIMVGTADFAFTWVAH